MMTDTKTDVITMFDDISLGDDDVFDDINDVHDSDADDDYVSLDMDEEEEKEEELVDINVAGEPFQTYKSTLERYPDTLLGDRVRRQEYYVEDAAHFFFDRHRYTVFFYRQLGF